MKAMLLLVSTMACASSADASPKKAREVHPFRWDTTGGSIDVHWDFFETKYDACYDAVLALDPSVAGVADIRFDIPPDGGRPVAISVVAYLFTDFFRGAEWVDKRDSNHDVLSCVLKVTEASRFPAPKASKTGAKPVSGHLAVLFRPAQ